MIVSVEQGAVNPSVGTLLRLSDALGVGLPTLVEPPESKQVTVTRRGEGMHLWAGTSGGRGVLMLGTSPPNVIEMWDWTLEPGERHASEAHAAGTQELLSVLDGPLDLDVDGQVTRLQTGDAVAFPGDVDHGYVNAGSGTVRFCLTVFEPGVGVAETHRG